MTKDKHNQINYLGGARGNAFSWYFYYDESNSAFTDRVGVIQNVVESFSSFLRINSMSFNSEESKKELTEIEINNNNQVINKLKSSKDIGNPCENVWFRNNDVRINLDGSDHWVCADSEYWIDKKSPIVIEFNKAGRFMLTIHIRVDIYFGETDNSKINRERLISALDTIYRNTNPDEIRFNIPVHTQELIRLGFPKYLFEQHC
jgi:hypothetical protein